MTSFYTGEPQTMERLQRFLNAHAGKQLEFICDDRCDWINDDDWAEFEDPEPDTESAGIGSLAKR